MIDLPAGTADALAALYAKSMTLQCLVQDGEVQVMADGAAVALTPVLRQS